MKLIAKSAVLLAIIAALLSFINLITADQMGGRPPVITFTLVIQIFQHSSVRVD